MLIWPLFVVGYNAQSMLSLSHTHFVYEIKFNMRNSKEQKYNETLSIIPPVKCFLGCITFTVPCQQCTILSKHYDSLIGFPPSVSVFRVTILNIKINS